MAISLKNVRDKLQLTPERAAGIEARSKQLIEEELTLRDLRKAQRLTQQQLAELLHIEQDSISRMERRADMLLSTMNSYVQAMGGVLRLVAEFPDRAPMTIRLGDLAETQAPLKSRKRGSKKKLALTIAE
jgi:DNA-binding XRE family transcriptional regulator